MRIISGHHRGKVIRAPELPGVRPTTDFAKTGLFNLLANRVDFAGLDVLDLFCGTGNIAYEFLSRGARFVTAVDSDRACIRFIRQTLAGTGWEGGEAVKAEVLAFLRGCRQPYDLVFADPPYDYTGYEALLRGIFSPEVLRPGGLVVLEHLHTNHFTEHPNFVMERKYGQSAFSFFRPAPQA